MVDSASEAVLAVLTVAAAARSVMVWRAVGASARLLRPRRSIFGHGPAPGAVERTRDAVAKLPAFWFRYNFRDVRGEATSPSTRRRSGRSCVTPGSPPPTRSTWAALVRCGFCPGPVTSRCSRDATFPQWYLGWISRFWARLRPNLA